VISCIHLCNEKVFLKASLNEHNLSNSSLSIAYCTFSEWISLCHTIFIQSTLCLLWWCIFKQIIRTPPCWKLKIIRILIKSTFKVNIYLSLINSSSWRIFFNVRLLTPLSSTPKIEQLKCDPSGLIAKV